MDQNTFETPTSPPPVQPPSSSRKKWILTGSIVAVVLVAAGVAAVLLTILPKNTDNAKQPGQAAIPKEFKIASTGEAISYAGNKMYDACSFISFDTVRRVVENYQSQLDTIGTDRRATDPLVIEHRYVDRDIASPLGKDGQPREKSTTVGGSGVTDIGDFMSSYDSNCWYGQGEDIATGGSGSAFAKVQVSQLPVLLSQDLKNFLGKLTKTTSADGVDVYVQPELDDGGFATVIFANQSKNLVVALKVGNQALVEPMMSDVAKVLTNGPAGPVAVEYPAPWEKLKNPCMLLTAADFEQFTGKKAQALADEQINLTELENTFMKRKCYRLEVDNLDNTEISTSTVTARLAKSEANAKAYIEKLKSGEDPLAKVELVNREIDGADEAYVVVRSLLDEVRSYEFEVRAGAAVLTMVVEDEKGLDKSTDAFIDRMMPVVNSVLKKWRE
jgi:hypothetical protein